MRIDFQFSTWMAISSAIYLTLLHWSRCSFGKVTRCDCKPRKMSFCSLTRLNLQNEDPFISRQLTTNKAFKRGSSFCSSSRPYFTCHTRRSVAATCRGDVSHRVSRPLSEGLRFVVWPGLIYKTKLSLIHISEPTRRTPISYAVFCLKKKIFIHWRDVMPY